MKYKSAMTPPPRVSLAPEGLAVMNISEPRLIHEIDELLPSGLVQEGIILKVVGSTVKVVVSPKTVVPKSVAQVVGGALAAVWQFNANNWRALRLDADTVSADELEDEAPAAKTNPGSSWKLNSDLAPSAGTSKWAAPVWSVVRPPPAAIYPITLDPVGVCPEPTTAMVPNTTGGGVGAVVGLVGVSVGVVVGVSVGVVVGVSVGVVVGVSVGVSVGLVGVSVGVSVGEEGSVGVPETVSRANFREGSNNLLGRTGVSPLANLCALVVLLTSTASIT